MKKAIFLLFATIGLSQLGQAQVTVVNNTPEDIFFYEMFTTSCPTETCEEYYSVPARSRVRTSGRCTFGGGTFMAIWFQIVSC